MMRRLVMVAILAAALVASLAVMRPGSPPVNAAPLPAGAHPVELRGEGGTLAGTLTMPTGTGPHHAVVLLAGFGPFNRDGSGLIREWSQALAARGFATLRYDKRGIGGSDGKTLDWLDPRIITADARSAIAWLKTQPGIRSVSVMGHSQGGDIALIAGRAARRVVTAGAPGRSLAELGRAEVVADAVSPAVRDAILRADPPADARRLNRPLLLIHGSADDVVPVADVRILRRARTSGQMTRLIIVPGGNHSTPRATDRTTFDRIAAFVRAAG